MTCGRERIAKEKIQEVIKKEKNLKFPEFVKELRLSLGITQRAVAEQSKIKGKRLFRIESHTHFFKIGPSEEELELLAEYYGISLEILTQKLADYRNKRCRWAA